MTDPDRARLVINASNLFESRNWIKVELLDAATNQPLQGYGRSDCEEIVQEGIRIPIRWGANDTLRGVNAPAIKIRFHLWGVAKLHSFHFE